MSLVRCLDMEERGLDPFSKVQLHGEAPLVRMPAGWLRYHN
jgi:hypothetical protein